MCHKMRRWASGIVTHDVEEALLVAHRVYVMTRAPGHIKDCVMVPFGHPRGVDLVGTAAALVVLPLAMLTAARLGLDARPFAATVTLAASCSFIAPLEPAAMLV